MKAVLFPGQGAQYVGMGKSLYDNYPKAKEVFDTIDKVLGFELSKKCFEGSEEELKDTAIQQLAILATSIAAFEVFRSSDIKIDYLSGLSLGEYSCLYVAEALSLEDLVVLVRERARAMQKAASMNPSTMFAVIGATREVLEEKATDNSFYLANMNSPQQIVISLSKDNRDKVKSFLDSLGLRVVELAVSGGFHSPFMEPAKKHLAEVIDGMGFCDAKIAIVSNFTAHAHTEASQIKSNLLNQLVSPVLWNDCVGFMAKEGVDLFFEVGPAKVLRGLMRKINPELKVINIEKKEDMDKLEEVKSGI